MPVRSQHRTERRGEPKGTAALALAAVLLGASCPAARSPAAAPPGGRCIVIDSDAALDDFRAVAALAPTGRIAAIVVTEGIARAAEGAGAMEVLLRRGDLSVPVIPGAGPDPDRPYRPDERLPEWRANAERLNGLLPSPCCSVRPGLQRCRGGLEAPHRRVLQHLPPGDRALDLLRALRGGCPRTGRPDRRARPALPGRARGRTGRLQLRLRRGLLLRGLRPPGRAPAARGPEVPGGLGRHPERPQSLRRGRAGRRRAGGAALRLPAGRGVAPGTRPGGRHGAGRGRRAPRHPEGWQETSLWDDLAALFLLQRDVFVIRGGHFEPCIPAGAVRKLLAAAMGRRGTR